MGVIADCPHPNRSWSGRRIRKQLRKGKLSICGPKWFMKIQRLMNMEMIIGIKGRRRGRLL